MIYIYGFIPVFTGLVLVMNVFGYRFARVLRTSVAGLAVPAVQGGTPPIQPPVAPPSASPPTA